MRIGIAAASTPGWPKCDWVEQAARRLGHDVVRSTDGQQLPSLLANCEIVIAGQKSLAGRWPNIRHAVAARRARLVYWWFDLVVTRPGETVANQPLFRSFASMFQASDYVLVKERGLLEQYRAAGCRAWYFDQGCPSDLPEATPLSEPQWDVLVWGQNGGGYRERRRHVEMLAGAGYRIAWAGWQGATRRGIEPLPHADPATLAQLASRARCVISCGVRNDLEGYWSDGFWMALGLGACVIRRSTPGLPEGDYLLYHNESELLDAVGWVVENPARAALLGRKARQWVMQRHTIEQRVERLIRLVRTAEEPAFNV